MESRLGGDESPDRISLRRKTVEMSFPSSTKYESMSYDALVDESKTECGYSSKSRKSKSRKTSHLLAVHDHRLSVPLCSAEGQSCSSGRLVEGRNGKGPELNSPNTLDGCADGTSGAYLVDESIEMVKVSSVGGGLLRAGCMAEIEALVYCWGNGSQDYAYFYSTTDIRIPLGS